MRQERYRDLWRSSSLDHNGRLRRTLGTVGGSIQTVRQAGLKLKPSKCCLLPPRVPYLGHVISAEGVSHDPAKIEAARQWPVPWSVTDVRSFRGLASY